MNQKEVVETLLDQAKIEPGFTELGNHEYLFDWWALCYFFFLMCKTHVSWFIFHFSLLMQLLELQEYGFISCSPKRLICWITN
jgi:hypothetical protein